MTMKMHLAAGLAAAALMSGAALAQTTPATQTAGSGQVMTELPSDQFRASKLMGVDVYGTDNAKIGDIDEILIDKMGKIHGVVVGVGGFLGIGQKDVAIPFAEVQWMTSREVQAQTAAASGTNTAGGVSVPASGMNTNPPASGTNPPATTGSTGMGTAGSAAPMADDTTPTRAMVKMTKADLQNAPEFKYNAAR